MNALNWFIKVSADSEVRVELDTPSCFYTDALDAKFLNRLLHPVVQPGLTDHALAKGILARFQRFGDRLPLSQLAQQRMRNGYASGQIPIVYAQSLPPATVASTEVASPQAPAIASPLTVVQAKFVGMIPLSTVPAASNLAISNPAVLNLTISNPAIHTTSVEPQIIETQNHSASSSTVPQTQETVPPAAASPMSLVQQPMVQERSAMQNYSALTPAVTELQKVVEINDGSQTQLPISDFRSVRHAAPTVTEFPAVVEINDRSPSNPLSTKDDSLPVRRVQRPPHQLAQRVVEESAFVPDPNQPLVTSIPVPPVKERPAVSEKASAHAGSNPTAIAETHPLTATSRVVRLTPLAIASPLKQVQLAIPQQSSPHPNQVSSTRMRVTAQPINPLESTPLLFSSPALQPTVAPQSPTETLTSEHPFPFETADPSSSPTRFPQTTGTILMPSTLNDINAPTTVKPEQMPKLDVEAIANQVERKLMRRLIVERERRGQTAWKR